MTRPSRLRLASALAVLGICLAGSAAACDGGSDDTSDGGDTFIAFATNFTDYRAWKSEAIDASVQPPASTHLAGNRTVFINKPPAHGSTEFPVGTIIVKELEEGALGDRQVFAMVKRGGTYNAKGASGWEWFELGNIDDSKVKIIWHGVGPPAGEKYGGDPNGGCNGCHAASTDNDFVQTTALDLTSF